ncbi:MAG TPA: TetR/AcrR family transcriptional regulator [Lachnospiraceae bacterium]|nr:TetR/AcrR family transcriptional regulator [Lachnospiraceae bacterium]
MYTGTNPTAVRSQNTFTAAVLEMMKSTAFSKITVKAICEKAQLSRQTFYEFFDSKEDVIRQIIHEKLFNLPEPAPVFTKAVIENYFYSHIYGNRAFLRLLAKNNLEFLLSGELSASLEDVEKQLDPGEDKNVRKIATAFLTSALTGSFLVWAEGTVKISEKDFIELIYSILRGNYFKIS